MRGGVGCQAHSIGVPTLYFCGALCMLLMVLLVFLYVQVRGRHTAQGHGLSLCAPSDTTDGCVMQSFGCEIEEDAKPGKTKKAKAGVMEGFTLFMEHTYVRGIFALSCLFMVEVTILDYIMKVLAKRQFTALYPDDPLRVTDEFASFMGLFGQVSVSVSVRGRPSALSPCCALDGRQITNSISFLFSLTGTSFVIRRLGLYK
jgi:ATP:ADP antiporter, AAA family